jgi:hypothetical protein
VKTGHFNIFERASDGKPYWVQCLEDLLSAHKRISELQLVAPGQYFIYDETSGVFEEERTKRQKNSLVVLPN